MKTSRLATVLLSIALLTSCKGPEAACTPNFTQGGFSAQVSYVDGTLNDFEFKVCSNDEFLGSQVSIYGLNSQIDISSIHLASDVRLPHMTDGLYPGDTFTVPFNDDDSWFVIFEDDGLGDYSDEIQILSGQIR